VDLKAVYSDVEGDGSGLVAQIVYKDTASYNHYPIARGHKPLIRKDFRA